MKLIAATKNLGKLSEIKSLLKDLDIEITSLNEYKDISPIIENGDSFEENAIKKATLVARHTGFIALSDDSGLEVDHLNGAPGIHSARFAGEPRSDLRNINKLLKLMEAVPLEKRKARFKCVIALAHPDGKVSCAEGCCEGFIAFEPRGSLGFGYDPIFIVPEYNMTFAELGASIKNRISHRAKALAKVKETIIKLISSSSDIPA